MTSQFMLQRCRRQMSVIDQLLFAPNSTAARGEKAKTRTAMIGHGIVPIPPPIDTTRADVSARGSSSVNLAAGHTAATCRSPSLSVTPFRLSAAASRAFLLACLERALEGGRRRRVRRESRSLMPMER